jgi:hypothetical protein
MHVRFRGAAGRDRRLQRELGEATDAEIRIYRICRECLAVRWKSERRGTFGMKERA